MKWRHTVAIGVVCAALSPGSASAGQPTGGASSIVCDEQGVCVTGQTVECRKVAFPWFLQCWSKREGAEFSSELRRRGVSPHRWKERWPQLARTFGRHWPDENWDRLDRDFDRAVAYSGGRFGVSTSWMRSCAASEGGTTPGHIAVGAAGEHGWWQYLPGTFDFMSNSAFGVRGHPPVRFKHRDSLLGQAWTTAWAFDRGLSYHWHGAGC